MLLEQHEILSSSKAHRSASWACPFTCWLKTTNSTISKSSILGTFTTSHRHGSTRTTAPRSLCGRALRVRNRRGFFLRISSEDFFDKRKRNGCRTRSGWRHKPFVHRRWNIWSRFPCEFKGPTFRSPPCSRMAESSCGKCFNKKKCKTPISFGKGGLFLHRYDGNAYRFGKQDAGRDAHHSHHSRANENPIRKSCAHRLKTPVRDERHGE